MQESVKALIALGKIPDDADMSDALFERYDSLLQSCNPLSPEEAQALAPLFSDDCDDLNWGLLHLIETAAGCGAERYRTIISACGNAEFREMMEMRLNNSHAL